MSRTHLAIAFVGSVVLLLQISQRCQVWSFEQHSAIAKRDSIQVVPSLVRFDDLQLEEVRSGEVAIRNQTDTLIELAEPLTSCGCVAVKLDQSSIPAGGETLLRFQMKSGDSPGTLSQSILLKTANTPMLSAKLQIEGKISARFWSDPPQLNFELDSTGFQTFIARIYRQESSVFAVYESKSTKFSIENIDRYSNFDLLHIKINADHPGTTSLAVFDRDSADSNVPIGELPVQWRFRPTFIYVPRFVDVWKAKANEPLDITSVFVYTSFDLNDTPIKFRARVPWCQVVGAIALNSHCYEIKLKTTRNNTVDGFVENAPILSIWKSDEMQKRYNLFGVMK